MGLNVAVLPGDGIGPEVIRHAVRVLRTVVGATHRQIQIQEYPIGAAAIRHHGTPLPDFTLKACLESDAVLLGAVGDPSFERAPAAERPEAGLLKLRKALGAFANLRPVRCEDELVAATPYRTEKVRGADLLIVRELLGGLYFGEPRGWQGDEAFNTMRYTRSEVERVARVAFEEARVRRGLVTSVDKANVIEASQLWRATVAEVARDYPDVQLEHMYVDACAMRLAVDPLHFDVIVTENLFGDILSDQAAAVAGSIGMLPSASLGGSVDLYEPVHGSAPDIAGKDRANPFGAIASAAMLLRYTAELPLEASLVEQAIRHVLEIGFRPADLAPAGTRPSTTTEVGEAVEHALAELIDHRHSYHAV
jgi:3-isopropylmalate dehydrogenase